MPATGRLAQRRDAVADVVARQVDPADDAADEAARGGEQVAVSASDGSAWTTTVAVTPAGSATAASSAVPTVAAAARRHRSSRRTSGARVPQVVVRVDDQPGSANRTPPSQTRPCGKAYSTIELAAHLLE